MIIKLCISGIQITSTNKYSSLLVLLEAHNIYVEYQCRKGYCGSCRMRLIKGEVSYASQPLAYIQKGEILPCCCMANSNIEIDL